MVWLFSQRRWGASPFAAIGMCATVAPNPVGFPRTILTQDGPFMILTLFLFLLFVRTGRSLSRKEGAVFAMLYAGYIAFAVYRI